MQELEKSWGRVARVWWLVVWRAGLGGILMAGAFGFVAGGVMGAADVPLETITLVTSVCGFIISVVWGLIVFRMARRKVYGDFRISLVPRDAA
jgi:hypothetical protein